MDGKRPTTQWKDRQTRRLSEDEARTLHWPGVGLALGNASSVVRLDADGDEAQRIALQLLDGTETAEFATPSGGRGWLFESTAPSAVLWRGAGEHQELRLMSTGTYTVIPPTPGYEWVRDVHPAPLPLTILSSLSKQFTKDAEVPITYASPTPELITDALLNIGVHRADDRDTWIRVGMALHSGGDDYLKLWTQWSKQSAKFRPGECEEQWAKFDRGGGLTLRYVLHLAKQDGWRPPRSIHEPITDLGMANVFARVAAGRVKHCVWGWMAWDGRRWMKDHPTAENIVQRLQEETLLRRIELALRSYNRFVLNERGSERFAEGKKRKEGAIRALTQYEQAGKFASVRSIVQANVLIECSHEEFDRQPHLFNCANGTLDLLTMLLRPHSSSDSLTRLCPTAYDPDAEAPRWEKFVSEVQPDADAARWLQKLIGYGLTGYTREHILPIFYGDGRNGKSTFVETVCSVLGKEYACAAPPGLLILHHNEQHPTAVADLFGQRLVFDAESGESAKLNEPLVKKATGSDRMKARRMHEDFWEFDPSHKVVLITNFLPRVQGSDRAIWARIRRVNWPVSFEGKEDVRLKETLATEAEGVLAWAVRGCRMYFEEGLGAPPSVQEATDQYRQEQNTFAVFFLERCEIASDCRTKIAEIGAAYHAWCHGNRSHQMTPKAWGATAARLGAARDTTGKYYSNVRLT